MKKRLVLCLLSAFKVSTLLANDLTPIGAILSKAESYQLQQLSVGGIVSHVHPLSPYLGRLGPVYGACTFMLDDGTGAIEVHVSQNCMISDLTTSSSLGVRFEIHGRVQAVTDNSLSPSVVILASEIRRLGN